MRADTLASAPALLIRYATASEWPRKGEIMRGLKPPPKN